MLLTSPLASATYFVRTLAPKWAPPLLPIARLASGEKLQNRTGYKFIPITTTVYGLASLRHGDGYQIIYGKTGRRRQYTTATVRCRAHFEAIRCHEHPPTANPKLWDGPLGMFDCAKAAYRGK